MTAPIPAAETAPVQAGVPAAATTPAPAPAPAYTPAPAPVPAAAAVTPPVPAAPATAPATGTNGPHGYPDNTPLAEMSTEQQLSYWKHQSRRHEDRVKAMSDYDSLKAVKDSYDALVAASQTDQERAVAEARRQGHAEAMGQAGGRLVEAYVRAAAAGRLADGVVDVLVTGLDRGQFLNNATGEVDTDRVYQFVAALTTAAPAVSAAVAGAPEPQQAVPAAPAAAVAPAAPVPSRMPDFGQGHPAPSRPTGIEAGREIARQRFAKQ